MKHFQNNGKLKLLIIVGTRPEISVYTHNDGTHIIVRSWNEEKECFEYHVEWIHGVLSPDKNKKFRNRDALCLKGFRSN